MIAVIDNYDSFTYNLVQYLGELGADPMVFRNDAICSEQLEDLNPSYIVVSPGPGRPADAGASSDIIQTLGKSIPVLGVCLGHQCIGEVFGGCVQQAPRLMHGKTSQIYHYGGVLFQGVSSPFEANRYHSLIVDEPVPEVLEVTAFTKQGEVMGLRHKAYPIYGLQFHPESVLTPAGKQILRNFLSLRGLDTQVPELSLTNKRRKKC
ncbi:MAG TPA: aminodeoxychorismate/anthranilate synthase component II [Anaerolineales bacterium]|jgi:anthranilate synthase/aminodeoxychorismate synthase-like glutamine amidotransferase|nr:aminodeoxychorismate/anthranilate synthase component II [Anaerolineales bacterium]